MKITFRSFARVAAMSALACITASLLSMEGSHATEQRGASEPDAAGKQSATQKPGVSPVEQGLQIEVSLVRSLRYYTNVPNVGAAFSPVWLKMKITNIDHAPFEVFNPFSLWRYYYPKDWPYTIKILDAHGQPVPETAYARDLERQSHHPVGRTIITDEATLPVSKGKAFVAVFPAGMYYDLTLPGKYTVQVTYKVSLGSRKEDGAVTLKASAVMIDLLEAPIDERDSGVLDREQDSNVLQADEIRNEYARKLFEKIPDKKQPTPK